MVMIRVHLPGNLPNLSKVVSDLTISHSNAAEETAVSLIRKMETEFSSNLDLN